MKKIILLSAILCLATLSGCTQTPTVDPNALFNGTPTVSKTIPSAFEGSKDSKAQLMVFSDFQCPACQSLHSILWPKLQKDYIATGKIGVTYKNFPLTQHQNAQGDALAALCALDAGKYAEFSEKMYAFEKQKNNADVSDAERVTLATSVGISKDAFTKCYSEGWYWNQIKSEMAEGERLGLDHTPSIYLNGKIMDFKSEEEFFQMIDGSIGK